MKKTLLIALALGAVAVGNAQVIAYSNTTTAAQAGFSSTDLAMVTGDALSLTQPGRLHGMTFGLFNSSSSGNTGAITAGTMQVKFYDNTTAYAGGVLGASQPLLGTINFTVNFGASPLNVGFYSLLTATGLQGLNVDLTQNVFVTQQFTQTTGTSIRYGMVILGAPTVGSSPNNVYIKSTANPEGLYTVGTTGNQMAYQVTVPEPASMAILGLGLAGLVAKRRRK